jgi:hypothetical protein
MLTIGIPTVWLAHNGGWGYDVFDHDAASDTFKPGTTASTPPQGNDAKCGFACQTRVKARDYVFTEYGKRGTSMSSRDVTHPLR